jgi:hypothetical protein
MTDEKCYCVVADTTKGRVVFRLRYQVPDYASVILQFLTEATESKARLPVTVVTPGLLQLKLGRWPTMVASQSASRAQILRGSLSVTPPASGTFCNLLLARSPARRIEPLYFHLGWVQTGLHVVDELDEHDVFVHVFWGLLGEMQA